MKRRNYLRYLRSIQLLQTSTETRRTHSICHTLHRTTTYCRQKFGFVVNPTYTHWSNKTTVLKSVSTSKYFNPITNLTFHNLCKKHAPPTGTKQLLGLGHKFIPQRPLPTQNLHSTFSEFARNVRLKYTFSDDNQNSNTFTKNDRKIYIKSTWSPEHGNNELENRLNKFHTHLQYLTSRNLQSINKSTNLTRPQTETLSKLKADPHTITLLTDKNLGPVVMDRQEYINRVFSDHLLDNNTYQRLSKQEADQKLDEILEYLLYTFENPSSTVQNSLSEQDMKYFSRALHKPKYRTPTFYGLIKIHKTPWKIRPVVSCCGSLLARLSTWVDFHLQRLKKFIPSYIQDSEDLQQQLSSLQIPRNTRIFTCDAVSMYTNIDVDHSISIIKMWFQTFQHELPPNFPSGFLVTAITIIMKNNIFTFGDTHWLQRMGTAMGTPCACMLATIYFSFHERTKILPKYSTNILFYRRYIDDVICLWTNPTDNTLHSNHTYECLKNDMNEFGNLRWEFEPLTLATTFLDLNIKITHPSASEIPYQIHQSISFSTYQKEHNLYLYLPPYSAHPPGITRSLINGLIRKY